MSKEPAPKSPRSIGRIVLRIVGVIVALLALVAAGVYVKSELGMRQTLEVAAEDLVIPTDADSLALGRRLASTGGCLECHGTDGAGRVPIRAMPVLEVRTPNLTPAGPTARYSGRDWSRAVRHGVRPDGTVLLFMPCRDFQFQSDRDLGAIVAYLKTLPPVRRDVGRTKVGPLGRLLYVLGELPLVTAELIDHDHVIPEAPPVGPTAEYGAYLANGCTGCHGEHLSGGPIPGAPPEWPPAANLTAHESGLRGVTEAQFVATLTTGARRSGGTIDPMHMPWRQFAQFTPDEQRALFLYLQTVPGRPAGGR